MKVKQRTICQTCRKKKLACDGKLPACSQCALRGLVCPGYRSDWVFIQHVAHTGSKTKNKLGSRRPISPREAEARPESTSKAKKTSRNVSVCPAVTSDSPAAIALSDLIITIIDNYVPDADTVPSSVVEPSPRICGSWVEVLPELAANDTSPALASAIRAFAMTIRSRGPRRSVPACEGLEAYNQALIAVNDALRSSYSAFSIETAAAVMCLLLVELFHVNSLCSWKAHLGGLADLMQLSRPELYASGIPHRLFVGARPLLVVLAFMSRKSTFLASEEWKNIPFLEIGPSPMQTLISEAAIIPALLERMDAEDSDAVLEELLRNFEAVLDRLNAWADAFQSSTSNLSPLFWFQAPDGAGKPHIWFQSITVANALTHFWAFRVVCLRKIDELRSPPLQSDHALRETHFEEVRRLSVMICQSTEYLMQDEMKLFGPASVFFPLQTACETFYAGGDRTSEELEWCETVIAEILNRGYGFMSFSIGV